MQHLHLISDSNIIIDMEAAGLIERIFQLPYVFAVPDILYHQELRDQHSHLPANQKEPYGSLSSWLLTG